MRGLFRWVLAVLCGAMAWSLWSADGFFDGRQPVGFYPGSEFPGARGAVTATNGEARLDYDFSQGGAYVAASLNLSPRRPARLISFEVFHDAPCGVSIRFWDATGQVFQHVYSGASATGRWVRVECACLKDRTGAYWEGAGDGIVHLPLGLIQVMATTRGIASGPAGPAARCASAILRLRIRRRPNARPLPPPWPFPTRWRRWSVISTGATRIFSTDFPLRAPAGRFRPAHGAFRYSRACPSR